ncbi:MAG: MATE family efflux transporter [Armatimonadetes bacterium]|nr:MATE family efflux transporter [Armatimonadota bacterium]
MSESASVAQPRRVDLTQGSLLWKILLLSWPIVTGSFLQFLFGIVAMKMVGILGPTAIAAVGTSRAAIMTFMAAVLAVSAGTQVLTARFAGQRRADMVAAVTRQALIASVLLGVVLMPVGWFLARPLMAALGANEQVLDQATAYTRAYFLGMVPFMINFMLPAALSGVGDTLTPLYVLTFLNVINRFLDWFLIFGVGPFPRLGVVGAAWGEVISRVIGAVLLLWIVFCGRFAIHVPLRGSWRIDIGLWGKMFYIGAPNSIQALARNFSFLTLLWVLNQTAARQLAVAGHTIATQIQMVMNIVGLALMNAAMIAVSQNMGAKAVQRAERSGWMIAGLSLTLISGIAAVVALLARPMVAFFTNDAETIRWGVTALWILSAAQPFGTVSMAFSGALRGAGDTLSPLWATLIFTFAVCPIVAYTLAIPLGWGPPGTWVGMATAMLGQATTVGTIFKRGKWKTIRLERGIVEVETPAE